MRRFFFLSFLLLILLNGCGKNQAQNHLCAAGSEEFAPLFDRWSAGVREKKGEEISLVPFGNGTAAASLREGSCFLGALTRPLTDSEMDSIARKTGKPPIVIPVAIEALAIVVPSGSPVRSLSTENISELFTRGSLETIDEIYGLNSASDRYRFFKESALGGQNYSDRIQEIAHPLELADRVGRSRNAATYARPSEITPALKILAIEKSGSLLYPDERTVQSGAYPLERFYYFYFSTAISGETRNALLNFTRFALSEEGQKSLNSIGLYPLSRADRLKSLSILEKL